MSAREKSRWLFGYRLRIGIDWKPQDLWIGAFIDRINDTDVIRSEHCTHVWICLIPCVPIHLIFRRGDPS